MTVVIGTDEAGYGPNLGPLVVAATAWTISPGTGDADSALADRLVVSDSAAEPLWADSKRLFRAGEGLAALERGVLAGLRLCCGRIPPTWELLGAALGPISPPSGMLAPWSSLDAIALPVAAAEASCLAAAATAYETLSARGAMLQRIVCRCIYPGEFNALLGSGLNKSDILSQTTLSLAATLRADFPEEAALVWCDRHGGRKRYGGLVARHFETPLVRTVEETAACSEYLVPGGIGPARPDSRVEFRVGGEARIPVALASMAAKYVRELAMRAFNAFWASRQPGLQPTAGYPVDAMRWRGDAAAAIASAGIPSDDLWRRA